MSKIALVTGAGSGIGRAAALALHSAGFTVVLAGRRASEIEKTGALATASGVPMLAVPTDVSQPDSVKALFTRVGEEFGRLDVLFNNAGINVPAIPMDELTFEQWNSVVGINLTGSFLCAQHAMHMMKSQDPKGGRIINNGSIASHVPRPHSAPYAASKHAISGLTKATALDGRRHDIACGQIDIGNASTALLARSIDAALQPDGSRTAEPTMSLDGVARAVSYMASLPLDENVLSLTVLATKMPYVGRG